MDASQDSKDTEPVSHHGRGDGEGAPPGLGALGWNARQPGAGVLGGKARGSPETRGLGGETVGLLEVSEVKRPVAPSSHPSRSAGPAPSLLFPLLCNVPPVLCSSLPSAPSLPVSSRRGFYITEDQDTTPRSELMPQLTEEASHKQEISPVL